MIRNLSYLSYGVEANPAHIAVNLVGSLWSPNGGLVVYWGLALVVITILANAANRANGASRRELDRAVVIFVVLVAIGVLSNSLWWSAFGWVSWGNRLMIPYVLGSILYVFVTALSLCDGLSVLQLIKAGSGLPGESGGLLAVRALSSISITMVAFSSFGYLLVSVDSRQVLLNVYHPDQPRPACSAFHERPQQLWDRHSGLWYYCVEESFRYIPHRFNLLGAP